MGLKISVTPKLDLQTQVTLLQQGFNADALQLDKEAKIKQRIDSCQITATNFSTLSQDEQDTVRTVLFKSYSPDSFDVPKALSCAEFILVSMCKLMAKALDRSKLTSQESAFLDAMSTVISQNDMPIDNTTDWRFTYFQQQFTDVQNNRSEYLKQKQNVTGSV